MNIFVSTFVALSLIAAPAAAIAQAAPPMVTGEVTKIDAEAGKLTLDHAAIPNLDMGAMKMVFKAGDAAMLKTFKAGDKVKFTAERVNGQLTVTKIEKAK